MTAGRARALGRNRRGPYERPGLTVARFCDEEGLSAPSFYQWRKRLASRPRCRRAASMTRGAANIPRRLSSDSR